MYLWENWYRGSVDIGQKMGWKLYEWNVQDVKLFHNWITVF